MASVLGDQIRILDILPGDEGEAIKCELRVDSLSYSPVYDALSYTWGDDADLLFVEVSGRTVGVTRNLHAALSRLRLPRKTRPVWVDQLCINQDDYEEKSTQLRLMRTIYTQCTTGLLWLGDIRHDILMRDAAMAIEYLDYIDGVLNPWDPHKRSKPGFTRSEPDFQRFLRALRSMGRFECSWWTRIWTVQEAILPATATVLWGPFSIGLGLFLQAARDFTFSSFRSLDVVSSRGQNDQWAMFDIFRYCIPLVNVREQEWDPISIMTCWRSRHATDPRDKVYALTGLPRADALPNSQKCDYGLTDAQVYETVTWDLIQFYGDLLPLSMSPRIASRYATPGTPGWAMDLGPSRGYNSPWTNDNNIYNNSSANKGMAPSPITQQATGTLDLVGAFADAVAVVEDRFDTIKDAEGFVRRMQRWCTLSTPQEREAGLGNRSESASEKLRRRRRFAILMLNNTLRDKDWNVISPADDQDIHAIFDNLDTGRPSMTIDSIIAATRWRRFFITETGLMGFGHSELQPGDEVWVFSMGRVPFTLRKRTQTYGSVLEYDFYGPCYVEGLMQGEIFEEGKSQHQETTVRIH